MKQIQMCRLEVAVPVCVHSYPVRNVQHLSINRTANGSGDITIFIGISILSLTFSCPSGGRTLNLCTTLVIRRKISALANISPRQERRPTNYNTNDVLGVSNLLLRN